jgi:hypothetical protein
MNFEILNVQEPPLFDMTIAYAEKRTHPPYASSSFNNNDEIKIPIQQQDIYTFLRDCTLFGCLPRLFPRW